jgi:uncharacterized lipoprotein
MKQIITSNKTIIAAALLTLGLTGCALTPATESLNYQAQTGVAHVAHAENVTVNVVTTDSRVDKVIGHKKNNLGMDTADIKASEPVEVTVERAVEQELKVRGFQVGQGSNLKVTANVTKFYNEFSGLFIANATANVEIKVSVKNGDNLIYSKNLISTNNENAYKYAFPESAARKSLEDALAKAMTDLFNDPAFIAALTTAAPAQAAAN